MKIHLNNIGFYRIPTRIIKVEAGRDHYHGPSEEIFASQHDTIAKLLHIINPWGMSVENFMLISVVLQMLLKLFKF